MYQLTVEAADIVTVTDPPDHDDATENCCAAP
jgi:hypothetical protein